MAELETCPSRDDLHQMVMGKLKGTRAEAIALHLDVCPACFDALRRWIDSDEILEAAQAARRVNDEPTKTMYLPIGKIREAISTWIASHDETCSDSYSNPHLAIPSLADFRSVLSPPQSAGEIGRIAHFRVVRLLGIGGMAAVFEAEDTQLKRRVALKVLHPATAAKPGSIERFLREAQSAAALKHEHVVTIHQVGLHQETPFLVLELLHGETLQGRLARQGALSVREIVRIGREIAEGLAAAHARGLLHRDVKPANIWLEGPPAPSPAPRAPGDNGRMESDPACDLSAPRLDADAPSGKVKILDFGLAKSWSEEPEISTAGMLIGTPRYMAPEQVNGGAIGPRTDLFSLGCVLYRMGTGRAPFGGRDLLSVLRALACEEPPPVRALNPQVPSDLSDLIGQLMSKSPDKRPATAEAVAERLQAIAGGLPARRGDDKRAATAVMRDSARQRGGQVAWLARAVIALVVLLPVGYLFGAQLIRIATNKGQVVIQIDDPQVKVTIQENHVAIQDRPGQREITLTAGEHQLEVTVTEPTGERTFTTGRFTLNRGGRKVIDVHQELSTALVALPAAPSKSAVKGAEAKGAEAGGASEQTETIRSARTSGGADLGRRAAHWALSLGGSVTVHVRDQVKSIEVQAGTALPVADFDLIKINLKARPLPEAGLDDLTGLKNLNELVLSGTEITDAGLAHLEGLSQLKSLALDQTHVTDAGLAHLKGLAGLTSLRLGLTSVTDAGLAHLQGLTALKELALNGTRVTGAGLTNLRDMKNLRLLILNSSPVTDSGLVHLEGLGGLVALHLRATRVTDAGLKHLRSLTKLEILSLGYLPVTDAALAQLQVLQRLRYFDLGFTRTTDAGLKNLQTLKELRGLFLNHTQVTDAGLAQLEPLGNLAVLDLGETPVTDAGLAHLRGFKNLYDLRLKGARQVGDFAIPRLLSFPRLRAIDLSETHVSTKGLAVLKATLPTNARIAWSEPNDSAARVVLATGGHVGIRVQGAAEDFLAKAASELPSESFQITGVSLSGVRRPLKPVLMALKKPGVDALRSLDLSGTAIGDADLAWLNGLSHLSRLVLDGTNIQGRGLHLLQELPELRELRLGCPALTELFLVDLAGLKKLEKLSLAKSHVSDEGARQLAQFTHLKELDLSETKVTAAGVQELQKSLPACQILTAAAHH